MKKFIMLLSVALLLVSLACGTESTESTQISDATDGTLRNLMNQWKKKKLL